MNEKYILLSLEDPKTKEIAEIISNSTCRAILDFLSDGNFTEKELALNLKLPINTVEYNIKKLIKSGLVKSISHFWSVKGRKMPVYTISNKKILITPKKSKLKLFLPVILISFIFAGIIKFSQVIWGSIKYASKGVIAQDFATNSLMVKEIIPVAEKTSSIDSGLLYQVLINSAWLWFIAGSLFALLIFFIINYQKMKGGQDGQFN